MIPSPPLDCRRYSSSVRPLAEAVLADGKQRRCRRECRTVLPRRQQALHRDDPVSAAQTDPAHAACRATQGAQVVLGEPNRIAHPCRQHEVAAAVGQLHRQQPVALVDPDRDDAAGPGARVVRQCRLLHHAGLGGESQEPVFRELPDRDGSGDSLAAVELQQVDDRLAPRRRAHLGDLVHLEPVAVTPVGEHEDVAVGGRDVELLHEVAVPVAMPVRPLPPRCWSRYRLSGDRLT